MADKLVMGKRILNYIKHLVFVQAILAMLMLLVSFGAGAQIVTNKPIYLNSGTMRTDNNAAEWLNNAATDAKLPMQVLVQFTGIPTKDIQQQLKQSGVSLLQYIPDNAYIAVISTLPPLSTLQQSGIRFITHVPADWKLSDELKHEVKTGKGDIVITILSSGIVTSDELEAEITSYGGVITNNRLATMGYCTISLPVSNVTMLANWYGISYISKHIDDSPLNTYSKAGTRMQIAAATPANGGYGLKGAGIAIGVGDNTSGVFHADLADRIINYNPMGYTNHGVHINGITGGAGIVNPNGEGMAPAATLTNHYFSEVLEATPEISQQHNVIVTNNSYSATRGNCEYAGTYDVIAAGLDNLCNSYNTVFQVFAAANDGQFDCPPYPQGFATIAGGYQPAKNNIVVASTDKEYVNAGNSSRGPVKDGRLKPEITAVGVDVNSTTRNDEYLVASGTSMACPQVAGAAALLAERLKQINGTTKPRADVLKTLLINGADDIGIPGPDFRFGFGFLNVERSIIMLDSSRYITNAVANGAQATHNIVVPPNISQLKITLGWHDVAASPMAAKQLVNDIDLEVAEPANFSHRPLVLDPTPAFINNPAVEKEDRLNNTEQVVIDNPPAGNYTITVKGYSVPSGSQEYVLAYDFLPLGIAVRYPIAGSEVASGDSIYIYWDATNSGEKFTLQYTTDNGGQWNTIDNSIDAEKRHYKWMVPEGINSGRCRIRLQRANTGDLYTTALFVINTQPEVQLSSTQCPGYVKIEWGAIPNATDYEVMIKRGAVLAIEDTVSATEYVFSGLSFDTTYYVTARPIIDGMSGYRGIAKKRRPIDGNCSGNISDGDLMISKVVSPQTGRLFTSTQLGSNEPVVVQLRNLDDAVCDSYSISYSVNNGTWVTQDFTDPLAANATKVVMMQGIDLTAEGDYEIKIAVRNLAMADPVANNDSIIHNVSQLPNLPVVLDYTDGFETMAEFTHVKNTFGLGDGRRWDFEKTTDTGRIRSFVLGSIIIDGQRSVSMDAYKSCPGNFNALTGTFNLAAYNAATDEVRMEFDYIVHGVPKSAPGNELVVRGADTKNTQVAYKYDLKRENNGKVINSGSISLSDIMLNTGDAFSASTQIQFGQNDTSLIAARNFGNGLTIDNVKLYVVQNDVQVLKIVSPDNLACGVTAAVPIVVQVRNGVTQEQKDVNISYRLNKGDVVTETIASLAGKQTIDYSFSKLLDIAAPGNHVVDVWVTANGDTYNKNDSLLKYTIRNLPLITTYPYVEGFEENDGFWFADGVNSSWAHGVPTAPKINAAASGQKAWVTNLSGNYNDNEVSYLFSPCFDLTSMDNPTLNFKLAVDIENCEFILCDAGFMDYSTDGANWVRLGDTVKGVNWYNDTNYLSWTIEDKTAWHLAEMALPKLGANVQLRFGLMTDLGTTKEGMGVDDIRIFDNKLLPVDNGIISISPNPATDGVFSIEWSAHAGTEMKVYMMDIMGKEVYNTSAIAQEGYNKTTLHAPVMSTGMYFMRITIGDKMHKRKIIFRKG